MCAEEHWLDDEFELRVHRQCRRMQAGRKEEESSLWQYLGLLGMVGWSIAVPVALGALAGRWIDSAYETGDAWTFGLLLLGLGVGCFNAWRSLTRERD